MDSRTVELSVSADKDMMLVIRMTAAGALSRAGLTIDDIEDMKLAVDEACLSLMAQPVRYERLSATFSLAPSGVRLRVAGLSPREGDAARQNPAEDDEVLRCVLEAMADEAVIHRDERGIFAIELARKGVAGGNGGTDAR